MSKSVTVVLFDVSQKMTTSHRTPTEEDTEISLSSSEKNPNSPSPSKKYGMAKETISLIVKNSMIGSPKDNFSLVTIGDSRTNNSNNDDDEDEFMGIDVKIRLMPASMKHFEVVNDFKVMEGNRESSDIVGGLLVAYEMIKSFCGKRKCTKNIILVTNGKSPISGKGMKSVCKSIRKEGIQMVVYGVMFGESFVESEEVGGGQTMTMTCSGRESYVTQTQQLLKEVMEDQGFGGRVLEIEDAYKENNLLPKKKFMQRGSYFTFDLCQGTMGMPIKRVKYCEKVAFPTLKKKSKKSLLESDASDNPSYNVKGERKYYTFDDPDHDIELERTIKGHKYGKSVVPVGPHDEEQLKLETTKVFELIGFVDRKVVKRTHLMGETNYVFTDMRNKKSSKDVSEALTVLIAMLLEKGMVAIIRNVYRNNTAPKVCVLFPVQGVGGDYFVMHECPFVEDLRKHDFPSFETQKMSLSEDDLQAAEDLINAMELTKFKDDQGEQKEFFKPEETGNPSKQYFWDCLHHRAVDPNRNELLSEVNFLEEEDRLPEVSETLLKKYAPELTDQSDYSRSIFGDEERKPKFASFEEKFKTKKKSKVLVGDQQNFWFQASTSLITQSVGDSFQPNKRRKVDDGAIDLMSGSGSVSGSIRSSNPVEDMKTYVASIDSEGFGEKFSEVISHVSSIVFDTIATSVRSQKYEKGLDTIVEMRKICLEKKCCAGEFNLFMHDVKKKFSRKEEDYHFDFWTLLVNKKVGLISTVELQSSDAGESEAKSFFEEYKKEEIKEVEEEEEDDLDLDLLD